MTTVRRLPALRSAIWLLVAIVLFALVGLGGARAQMIARVDAIGITVADMDRALAFYTGVLPSVYTQLKQHIT